MTDTTEGTEQAGFDRRRFIKTAGAGAALVWAAPTVMGLDARAFAAGSDPDCANGTLQDDFDGETTPANAGGYATVTDLQNFTVPVGNVDIIGYPGSPYVYFGGTEGLYIDLGGVTSPSLSARLLSKQVFCTGTYDVSLRYAGSQRGDSDNSFVATLGLGSGASGPVASGLQNGLVTFQAVVTAGNDRLQIDHTTITNDNSGVILLEVSVTPVP